MYTTLVICVMFPGLMNNMMLVIDNATRKLIPCTYLIQVFWGWRWGGACM